VRSINLSTGTVDHMDFDIDINGLSSRGSRESLGAGLKEGDVKTIKLPLLGGG